MPRILHILAIDDNLDFLASLADEAAEEHLKIFKCRSLEGAQNEIDERGKSFFHGLILDYKCLKTEDQTTERGDFLPAALKYFDDNIPELPRVIISGETEPLTYAIDQWPDEHFYDKDEDYADVVFGYLRAEGEKLRDRKFIKQYRDVFTVFDSGKLTGEIREKLFSLLKSMNDYQKVQQNLASVRFLQDAILKSLSSQRPDLITLTGRDFHPKAVFKDLSDKGEVTCNIKDLGMTTYSITSAFGSHAPDPGCFAPTKYTVRSLVNHLLDLVLWAGEEWDG